MQEIASREIILKKIRQGLINPSVQRFPSVDLEKNVYHSKSEDPEESFAEAFQKVGGHFIFCENEIEFLENIIALSEQNKWSHFYCREKKLTDMLDSVKFPFTTDDKNFPEGMVGITTCEALVSRLGSVIISSALGSGRKAFVIPTIHIILAYTSQVVPEMKDALQLIKTKYGEQLPSMIASITGPSRTADIEKTLVTPAHGPRDIFVFLVDG